MSSRTVRLLFVLAAVAAVAASAFFMSRTDAAVSAEREAIERARTEARALSATIADLRAAQVAYVARGQAEEFWMGRVSRLLPVVDGQMKAFTASLRSAAAQDHAEPAAAAIDNFHKLDARAQEYVKSGDPLLASDLIFSDGVEAMAAAAAQVDGALDEELQAGAEELASLRRRELLVAASTAAVLLALVALGLTIRTESATEPVALTIGRDVIKPTLPAPAPSHARIRLPNLAGAAQLCTELARVVEPAELPPLLERAAKLVEATGLLVWVADPGGGELRPALSFGYSNQTVARMGTIARDAGNAVAAAYRAGELRTVESNGSKTGALVAPLMTPEGCVGVLSAETKGGSEKDQNSQALASIIAAQLATLVAAPSAALPRAAEA